MFEIDPCYENKFFVLEMFDDSVANAKDEGSFGYWILSCEDNVTATLITAEDPAKGTIECWEEMNDPTCL